MSFSSVDQTDTSSSLKPRTSLAQLSHTAGYFLTMAAMGLAVAILGPTLPGLAESTGTSLGTISFLFTARSLGTLGGAFLAGRILDCIAGHRLMAVMFVVMGAILFAIPFSVLFWLLAILMALLGLSEGLLDVSSNTLLVWAQKVNLAPFLNGLHFFFGFGALISPLIVAFTIAASNDFRWAYWILGLLIAPASIWFLRRPTPTAPTTPGSSDNPRANGNASSLVFLIAAFLFLYVAAEVSFSGWVYTYATRLNLAGPAQAAYLTSLFWVALTLGRLLGIPLALRLRPSTVLLVDLSGALLSLLLILGGREYPLLLWVGTFLLGFCMASVFPTAIALAERLVPITGRVTSWFFVGGSVGGMSLPWLVGQLFERFGPSTAVTAIFADLLLAGALYLIIRTRAARMEAPAASIAPETSVIP